MKNENWRERAFRETLLSNPRHVYEHAREQFCRWARELLTDPAARERFLDEVPSKGIDDVGGEAGDVAECVREDGIYALDGSQLLEILTNPEAFLAVSAELEAASEAPAPEGASQEAKELARQLLEMDVTGGADEAGEADTPQALTVLSGGEEEAQCESLRVDGQKVYERQKLDYLLRYGSGPRAVDGASCQVPGMELVGMFEPSRSDRSKQEHGPPTCLVVVWSFAPGATPFPKGLAVEELAFCILEGRVSWQLQGGGSGQLVAEPRADQLLWVSGSPFGEPAIPPFVVENNSGQVAYGLGVLYHPTEVPFQSHEKGLISVDEARWSSASLRGYWAAIEKSVHQMQARRPFTAPLPRDRHDLSTLKPRFKPDWDHRSAADEGFIVDYCVNGWPVDGQRFFNEISDSTSQRAAPMLDFGLFSLPVEAVTVPDDCVRLAKHGHFEVVVPLQGSVRSVVVESFPWESEPCVLRDLERGRPRQKAITRLEGPGGGYAFPDVQLINSTFHHGFAAARNEVSLFFGLRCFDVAIGPRRVVGDSSDVGRLPYSQGLR